MDFIAMRHCIATAIFSAAVICPAIAKLQPPESLLYNSPAVLRETAFENIEITESIEYRDGERILEEKTIHRYRAEKLRYCIESTIVKGSNVLRRNAVVNTERGVSHLKWNENGLPLVTKIGLSDPEREQIDYAAHVFFPYRSSIFITGEKEGGSLPFLLQSKRVRTRVADTASAAVIVVESNPKSNSNLPPNWKILNINIDKSTKKLVQLSGIYDSGSKFTYEATYNAQGDLATFTKRVTDGSGNNPFTTTSTFATKRKPKFAADAFSLTQFGIPEPGKPAEETWPLPAKIAVGAVGLLLLGGLIGILRRRQGRAA
jgi:hypothetical protein